MQLDFKQNDAEDELFKLYFGTHPADCACNLGLTPTFSLALAGRPAITAAALDQIRAGKSDPVNEHLFGLWFDNYSKAIDQAFGHAQTTKRITSMEAGFRVNVAQMAAYKAYRVTSELTSLRREVVSPKEFEQKTAVVLQKYTRYQGAEYQTIVARSRTAVQYLRFQAESGRFPNLTWLRTRSANPRERHLGYVGITLPIGHPFWDDNQPGNLYNCKCDWKTTENPVTKAPEEIVKPSAGLEGNPAITGALITDKHPYFKVELNEKKLIENKLEHLIRLNSLNRATKELKSTTLSITINSVSHKLLFSTKGLKHIAHNKVTNNNLKNILLPALPQMINDASFVKTVFTNENPMIVAYHYFSYNLVGKTIFINLRELKSGEIIPYAITPSIK